MESLTMAAFGIVLVVILSGLSALLFRKVPPPESGRPG